MNGDNQVKKASFIVVAIIVILALIVFVAFKFLKSKTNSTLSQGESEKTTVALNNNSLYKSKLYQLFKQDTYTITYGISDSETDAIIDILVVKDGENMFINYIYDDHQLLTENSTVIIDDKFYTIDHENKTIYYSQATPDDKFDFIADDNQEETLITGQETIADITYDTEDFGDGTIFYFLNNQLKMIKDQENNSLITIKNFSTTIDRSVFVLPSDYKMEEENNRAYINDDELTEEDLEALKAQGVEINLDELNLDLNSPTDD